MGTSVGALASACAILVLWTDGDAFLVAASISWITPVSSQVSLLFDFLFLQYRNCDPLCISMIIDTRGNLGYPACSIVVLVLSSNAAVAIKKCVGVRNPCLNLEARN